MYSRYMKLFDLITTQYLYDGISNERNIYYAFHNYYFTDPGTDFI